MAVRDGRLMFACFDGVDGAGLETISLRIGRRIQRNDKRIHYFLRERIVSYSKTIEDTRLVRDIEVTLTSGDLDYDGMALEVYDEYDNELFHVVVDAKGNRQLLFLAQFFGVPISFRDDGENTQFCERKGCRD